MSREIIPVDHIYNLIINWHSEMPGKLDLSEASQDTYKQGMERFLLFLHKNGLQASPTAIEQWKMSLRNEEMKTNTINTWISAIRNFYKWAVINGYLEQDPTELVKNLRRRGANTSHLRDALEDEEVLAVLDAADRTSKVGKRDYAYLCLRAYTGVRDVELYRADIGDLGTTHGKTVLRIRGKGRQDTNRVAVVEHPRAREALHEWIEERGYSSGALFLSLSNRTRGERLSLRACRWIVQRHLRLAGIRESRKTSHSFRHSAITKVAKRNILSAQVMAGHSDPKITMIYVHESDRVEDPGEQYIDYGD